MRVLFIARRFSYLKNFEAPILELARRGHHLHLVALAGEGKLEGTAMVERWAQGESRITFERLPPPPNDEAKIGLRARITMMVDYLRYLEPAYHNAAGLIERARRRTPVGFLRLLESSAVRFRPVRLFVRWVLKRLEAATPRRPELDAFLRAQAPDVVLFTPLIALQSEEQDLLTAAVDQRLRTVFCVLSWDNLSSKAIVRTVPDLVTVWNDVQRDEARLLHAVPDERIAVTGAQTFDHWFNREPSRSRAEFLTRVGLPTDRPFLLWVCSALFRTSPIEAPFVRRWIEALRASSDPLLREVSILVRPHPTRMLEWEKVPLNDLGPVALWGANPVDPESRNDYFDSLFYSEAVVGLNTSAFLEAAIVGRPVYTVLLPEYHESQEGTLHFPYLLEVADGLLHVTRDMESHLTDLGKALRQSEIVAERSRRFVEAFIRPRGLEANSTARFVGAIEDLTQRPAKPPIRPPKAGYLFRYLYGWLESRSHDGEVKAWLTSPNELEHIARREARLAAARAREEAKLAAARAREEQKRLKAQRRADRQQAREARAEKAAKKAARLERLRRKQAKEAARAERLRIKQQKEAAQAERLRRKEEAMKQHRSAKQSRAREEVHG